MKPCGVCARPRSAAGWCSSFCAYASASVLETFRTLPVGRYAKWPCSRCGTALVKDFPKKHPAKHPGAPHTAHTVCLTCWTEMRLQARYAVLLEVLEVLKQYKGTKKLRKKIRKELRALPQHVAHHVQA